MQVLRDGEESDFEGRRVDGPGTPSGGAGSTARSIPAVLSPRRPAAASVRSNIQSSEALESLAAAAQGLRQHQH